ncbi:hypothetical protein [Microbacterium dauci]|uniref:Uncharacterized protein n=1 Tax=Microbacterium dauci TaxID=3048008 RepID=A0ABT6ZBD8_9MICO|nr:hypothetical protein [Microbacterium sp. LX3-4]MDJ1113468.1 hypothetical protein [Microbacterium sp. LX3-4]
MLLRAIRPAISPCAVTLLRRADVPHPERAIARGELVRVRPGVFTPTVTWTALRPWERYLVRVHAVALTHPDAVFCHESAAALLGMPVIGDPVTVHVLVPASHAARESGGIRTHRVTTMPDLIIDGGLIVTTPASRGIETTRSGWLRPMRPSGATRR